jgi:hypothetical protein
MLNVDVIITGGDDDHHQLGQFETGLRVFFPYHSEEQIRVTLICSWLVDVHQKRSVGRVCHVTSPYFGPTRSFQQHWKQRTVLT